MLHVTAKQENVTERTLECCDGTKHQPQYPLDFCTSESSMVGTWSALGETGERHPKEGTWTMLGELSTVLTENEAAITTADLEYCDIVPVLRSLPNAGSELLLPATPLKSIAQLLAALLISKRSAIPLPVICSDIGISNGKYSAPAPLLLKRVVITVAMHNTTLCIATNFLNLPFS